MDFEDRKREYFKMLEEGDISILVDVVNSDNDDMKEIMLFPKNDRELMVAKATFGIMSDSKKLFSDLLEGNVKSIDMESSYVAHIFIKMIKALVSNDKEELNKCYTTIDLKKSALLLYEAILIFTSSPDDAIKYIASKCGFDTNNEIDLLKFLVYLKTVKEMTNKNVNNAKDFNKKELNEYVDFANEFHRLCEDGRVNKYTRNR